MPGERSAAPPLKQRVGAAVHEPEAAPGKTEARELATALPRGRDARRDWRSLAIIVPIALGVRLIVMAFLYREQLDPARDHWSFAYEVGRLARSIAQGRGFSSPLFADTGPSAWMTPAYPYFVAGVFKIFGIYTKASAFALLSVQALLSALTCVPVFFFARISFGEKTARYSAWGWALLPYAIYFPVERIWATWLVTLLLCCAFWAALKLKDSDSLWAWTGYGVLWGVAALVEPTVLSILPFVSIWACYHLVRRRKRWLAPAAISALAFIVVVSPWFVRNYRLFHQFIPFRDTMGLEWIIGNNGDTSHWRPVMAGPWHNPADWAEFQRVGELRYMAEKKAEAFAFIRGHWGWFARQTVRRFLYVWTGYWSLHSKYLAQEPLDPPNIVFCTFFTVLAVLGLRKALRRDFSAALPYAMVLVVFPFIYYFTHPEVYYRREIDPMMVVLAVYALLPGRVLREAVASERESGGAKLALAEAQD